MYVRTGQLDDVMAGPAASSAQLSNKGNPYRRCTRTKNNSSAVARDSVIGMNDVTLDHWCLGVSGLGHLIPICKLRVYSTDDSMQLQCQGWISD